MAIKPTADLTLFTEALAAQLLAKNPKNRGISKGRVRQWQRELERGKRNKDGSSSTWQVNGATIVTDTNGDLVDGQHRLEAIKNTGIPAWIFWVKNVEPEARDTLDQGRMRTIGDDLLMEGYARGNYVGAAAKLVINYLENARIDTPRVKSEQHDFIRMNPDILGITEKCLGAGIMFQPRSLIAVVFLGTRSPETRGEADLFLQGLDNGDGLALGDPKLALRELFSAFRMKKGKGGIPADWAMTACGLAWNEHVCGQRREINNQGRGKPYVIQESADGEYWPPNIIGAPQRGAWQNMNPQEKGDITPIAVLTKRQREVLNEVYAKRHGNGNGYRPEAGA